MVESRLLRGVQALLVNVYQLSHMALARQLGPYPFSQLPLESESHYLWGLHPRYYSRAGFHMQSLDNVFFTFNSFII